MTGSSTSSFEHAPSANNRPRVTPGHYGLLAGLAVILLLAFALQTLPYPVSPVVARSALLADYFPREMTGWRSEDRPLAETEALAGAVKSIINYDEALLRYYRKDDREFSLYVGYWQAGKMSSRELAFHIPDKCWVAVGWKRTAANYAYPSAIEGHRLAPAQYREFEAQDERQYVIYWHVFNGRVIVYNPDGSPSDLSMFTDLLRRGLRQKGEQYFIRIASRTPLEQLWKDDGFLEIIELVAPLGPGLHAGVEHFDSAR